ncbi:hypothetical protein ABPG73_012521 [Tetrahymena malaccensis]
MKKDQTNTITPNTPLQSDSPKKEQKEWDGEFYYPEINGISIPIPNFVQFSTIKNLFAIVEDVQKQFDNYLQIDSLKTQTLNKIHKEFIQKNENIIQKYSKKDKKNNQEEQKNNLEQEINNQEYEKKKQNKNENNKKNPQSHQRGQSGTALDMHLKQQNEIFNNNNNKKRPDNETRSQQSHYSKKSESTQGTIQKYQIHNRQSQGSYQNDLMVFLNKKITKNQESGIKIYNYIKQLQQQNEQTSQYPHLLKTEDYQLNKQQMEYILKTVDKYGVDKCNVQSKKNTTINTDTVTINFKENKVLKTIVYSILYRFITQQETNDAKMFICKILGYINPNYKGQEFGNFLLRQIFLHFIYKLVSHPYDKFKLISFLDELFAFEFISSLILDYFLLSAFKISKKMANDDINDQVECLASSYKLDLYLIDPKHNTKKCLHKRAQDTDSSIVFIYFEQSLTQQIQQPVYFVINNTDQLLAYL